MVKQSKPAITARYFDAVLFDLDGVLTATAKVHAACWKKTFDEFLRRLAARTGEPWQPFDIATDYPRYVDGKPRYEGVRSFLQARGVELPEGEPTASPDDATICGLGNRKNALFKEALATGGVEVYAGALELVRHLRRAHIKTAVVSSSKNCQPILAAAGIEALFDLRLDGIAAARLKLNGKPAPDTFLAAAERLGVAPQRAVVIEDAIAGVQAGRAGGFGLVVGVDRGGAADALRANGADVVVNDLRALIIGS